MSRTGVASLLLCTLSLTACAALDTRDLEARFEAGWRPSKGHCLFGGEISRLGAWCADVNFGKEGMLAIAREVNETVLARAAGRELNCRQHVAQAREELAAYPDYVTTELYSCDDAPPIEGGRPVCHVSLLVTSPVGWRVVLDNGSVLDPATTGGVAPYATFAAGVDRHWIGDAPDGLALATSSRAPSR